MTLLENGGGIVGRMHALTKNYRVSAPAYKRLEWHEEDQLNLRKYVPAEQSLVFERMDAILARINKLPKDNDCYGIFHTHLHHGNFYMHEGHIFAFDFDDACYDWFIRDIANILYSVLWFPVVPIDHRAEFAGRFMGHFLEGYGKKIKIHAKWLALIPDFLTLRRVFLYGVFHESRDGDGSMGSCYVCRAPSGN